MLGKNLIYTLSWKLFLSLSINILNNIIPDIFMHYIGPFDSRVLKDLNVFNKKNCAKGGWIAASPASSC